MSLPALRALTVAAHPQFAASRFALMADGWDSVALDVDDHFILKFPRRAEGETALRREVALLGVIRPRVALPVPDMHFFAAPVPHTLHRKLPGTALDPEAYARVPEAMRAEIGESLGRFYAQLHAIDPHLMRMAGAGPVQEWLDPEIIRARIAPLLPARLSAWADETLERGARLGPDPHGIAYGFFDGHGWNMAYEATDRRLGIFDFGDSGFGPLHQEFIYSNMIDPDLTARIVASYERHSGRHLDRARIGLLTDMHKLWEIAEAHEDSASVPLMLAAAESWIRQRR
ncbi:aminoglycoside resistance protein [Nostoc sp. 3335mG]|nr:aminoglycoside resistance protein [Nostoc sp. 3335mG]